MRNVTAREATEARLEKLSRRLVPAFCAQSWWPSQPGSGLVGAQLPEPGGSMATGDSDLALLADESISSWRWRLRNTPGRSSIRMQPNTGDSDFGELQLTGPGISARLFAQLKAAAKAPDTVLVGAVNGRQFCPRCWAEDWVSGSSPYRRRFWRVAWRTCCDRHGLFILEQDAAKLNDVKNPIRHPLIGLALPRWRTLPRIELETPRGIRLISGKKLPVAFISEQAVGQRAVHLENALSGYTFDRRRAWIPRGQGSRALREMYTLIVKSIVEWFSLDLSHSVSQKINVAAKRRAGRFKNPAWKEVSVFWQLPPAVRYSINVLAEAIIAVWTDSPLPGEAGAHRHTIRLVKALGAEFQALTATKLKAARLRTQTPVPRKMPYVRVPTVRVPAVPVRTEQEMMARREVLRRFYAGHPKVSAIVQYYERKKIKRRHDLRKEDND